MKPAGGRTRHIAFSSFLVFMLALSAAILPATAQAEITTNVDGRVSVEFSPMVVGQTVKTYQTDAIVTNTSNSAILAPIRLIVSNIDKKNTTVSNADGVASNGASFVEIQLDDGVLEPGESSLPTSVEFVRQVGNAPTQPPGKGKGKNKKPGFPTFSFDHSVEGGSEVALSKPASVPFALKPGPGSTSVRFSVSAVTNSAGYGGTVVLHGPGLGNGFPMDDSDGDGNFTATQLVNTSGLMGGDCLAYSASTTIPGGEQVVSPIYNLCATNFPLAIGESNTDDLVVIANTPAVGDEILVSFEPGTQESQVQQLLQQLGGEVIGTLLPQGLYQIRLPAVQTPQQLQQLIGQANNFPGVTGANANHVGSYTSIPNDVEFPSQYGLRLVSADSLAGSPRYVWDANATGGGITVLVLDSGIEATHPDLSPLPENTAGDNSDTLGHGTEMAGIIAATTDNMMIGIAGMARAASLQSIKISADALVTELEMLNGLTTALPLAGPNAVVNASFSIFGLLVPTVNMCSAINDLILAGSVVVNSAGNDNNSTTGVWPGMCNDPALNGLLGGNVIADPNKPSFIVVAASDCSSSGDPCATDSRKPDSNFGAWVDIAAPGVSIRSSTIAAVDPLLYTDSNGTSAAAALTSGSAAILRSCGVASGSVFSTLDLGATVVVTADFNRINVYDSLATLNTLPTAVGLAGGAINENVDTSSGSVVGTLSTSDATVCDAHSYAVIGGADAGSFSIGGAGNDLVLTAGLLNFEAKSTYSVTVETTDFFGATASQAFNVNVNDLDELPSITGAVINIDENLPNGTNVGAPIIASDEDAGASLAYTIFSGNTGAAFSIDASGQISVANSGALDFETNPVFNLTIQVTDNGDVPPLSNTAAVTVNLNDLAEGGTTLIDFDTRQDGTPYTGLGESFPQNEYTGVIIQDSDPDVGSTFVNLIDPTNVGTAISGYYANIGAFAGTPQTLVTLTFTTAVTELSFDYATPSGNLAVEAFDASSTSLGVFNFVGGTVFVNQAGFNVLAGSASISGIGSITSVEIRPDLDQALIVDNLSFTAP